MKKEIRGRLRCTILSFAAGLRRCHVVVVVAVASSPYRIVIHVPIVHLIVVVRVAEGRLVLRERGRRLGLDAIAVELLIECVEVLELERILLGGQEGL
jgi:hypothetical protein